MCASQGLPCDMGESKCTCYFAASVVSIEDAVSKWQQDHRGGLLSECLLAVHRNLYRYQISPPCTATMLGNPVLATAVVKHTLATGSVPPEALRRYHQSLSGLYAKYARPPRVDRCNCGGAPGKALVIK